MCDEFDSLEEPLAAVHRRLRADGERWQRNTPDTARLLRTARRLAIQTPTHISGDPMRPEISTATRQTTTTRMLRPQRIIPIVATALLVAFGFAVFRTFPASHPTTTPMVRATTPAVAATETLPPTARVVAPPPKDIHMNLPANSSLTAISMDSANDGWAVGDIRSSEQAGDTNPGEYCFFYHWHDGVWTRAPETFPQIDIMAMVMVGPDDGWAVGGTPTYTSENGKTVVLRYMGGKWQTVTIPVLPADGSVAPYGVYAPTPNFVWIKAAQQMVVNNSTVYRWFVLSFHDGVWSAQTTPFSADHDDISMTAPDDGWVAHIDTTHVPNLIHFFHLSGGAWHDSAQFPGTLAYLSMASATTGWAISAPNGDLSHALMQVYSFSGGTWTLAHATVPLPYAMENPFVLTATTEGTLWYTYGIVVVQSKGDNWQKQTLPIPRGQLSHIIIDGDGGVWALGSLDTGLNPVILYDAPNGWTIYGEN